MEGKKRDRSLAFVLAFLLVSQRCIFADSFSAVEVREGAGHLYNLSQSRGEGDLHRLAVSEEKEDVWLFSNGTWIDIGFDEDATKVLSSFEDIESAIEKLSKDGIDNFPQNLKLVYYHIHPRRIYKTGIYPPCIYDIIALALLKDRYAKSVQAIAGKLFDGYGRWEFDISDELVQRLYSQEPFFAAALRTSRKWGNEGARRSFFIGHESRARSILSGTDRSRAEIVREYIEAMAEIGVFLTYEEME